MYPLLLALTLAAAEPVAAPGIDEGALALAVEELMVHGRDAVRVAVAPVDDADAARAAALELALVQALLERRHEEVMSPALLRARLRAQAEAQELQIDVEALRPLSCDHLLLAAVLDEGGAAVLHLQLVLTEASEVLGEARVPLGVAGATTTAAAPTVRRAVARVAAQLAAAVESGGDDVRTHRVAVAPPRVDGAAQAARLDGFVQAELSHALRDRGFLVVERARLAAALEQAAVAQALDEPDGVRVGRMVGANGIVVGSLSEAGATFLLQVRLLDVDDGVVIGAASAELPRADVVTRADVETRTPLEAGVRSLLAPGWGQAYNGQGDKALLFGVGGYGALLVTLAGATGATVTSLAYDAVEPGPDLTPAEASQRARQLFELRGALLLGTAVAGGVTAMIWGGGVADALASAPHAEAP